jgi:hypothetical protein
MTGGASRPRVAADAEQRPLSAAIAMVMDVTINCIGISCEL